MRVYTVPLDSPAAVAAQVDIFEIAPAAEKPIMLLGFELGQTSEIGDAGEEMLEMALKIVTGAPTSGSGGSTRTARAVVFNDAAYANDAAGATIEVYNTTKLTGGTSATYKNFLWNVRMPLLYVPVPEARIICPGSEHLVLELIKTPADSIDKVTGWVEFAQLV
jgi:hypothetical protein